MALVSDLITAAFIEINAIAVGEAITSAEQTDAFARLNNILSSLSAEGAMAFNQIVLAPVNLTAGKVTYTVGASGDINTTVRAQRLVSWRAAYGGVLMTGGPVVSLAEVMSVPQTGETSVVPKAVGADTNFPLINLCLTPPPSASPGTIQLTYWTPITAFATVGDTITLPPAYERMLRLALAIELLPIYPRGADPTVLAANAQNAKSVIVNQNAGLLPQQATQVQAQSQVRG